MFEMNVWKRQELFSSSGTIDWSMYDDHTPVSFHEAQPALMASYATLWTVGILGNLWVVFVVGYLLLRVRHSHRAGDAPLSVQVYIFSLCMFDLLGLIFLPLLLLDLVYGSWTIPSPLLCKLYLLSEGFNKFGSPWLLTALSAFCSSNIRSITQFSYCNVSCTYGSQRQDSVQDKALFKTGQDSVQDKTLLKIGQDSIQDKALLKTGRDSVQNKALLKTGRDSVQNKALLKTGKDSIRVQSRPSNGSKSSSASFKVNRLLRRDTGSRAAVTVCLCSVAAVVAMSPVLLYSDIYYIAIRNETQVHVLASKCAFQPPHSILTVFTVYSFMLGYLCPAFLFTYYYATILYCVRKRWTHLAFRCALGRQARDRYCRVARTAIGLVSWTLAGWTPYWAIFLYFYFNPQTNPEEMASSSATIVLSYFVHMLPYITCTGYPILYTLLNKNLRSAYTREKRASANKKRRKRFASTGTNGSDRYAKNSNSSSPIFRFQTSLDCSTCDNGKYSSDEIQCLKLNAV